MKTRTLNHSMRLFLLGLFLGVHGSILNLHAALDAQPPAGVSACGMHFGSQCFDWHQAATIATGLKRTSFVVHEPRLLRGSCIRVNLSEPAIAFDATGRPPEWGQIMPDYTNRQYIVRTRRVTARQFMLHSRKPIHEGGLGLDMRVVVNANPWSPWQRPWNHQFADNTGLIVSRGIQVAPSTGRPSLVVKCNGQVQFRTLGPDDSLTDIETAVSGFAMIMSNGVITTHNSAKNLAPRTGFGLSRCNQYLYLLVIDGRQPNFSLGAYIYEVAEWLRYFGADSAINMDGGGSTTMLYWDPHVPASDYYPETRDTAEIHKLNVHANNAERTIGCALGIYLRPSQGAPTPQRKD